VLTTGAEPLMLLDYVAANEIELEQVAELVEGAADVCRDAGCRARRRRDGPELPGVYRTASSTSPGRASASSSATRCRRLAGRSGRRVVGFASAGVHANGFTLVRRVLEDEDYDGDDLLAPTRLYLDDVARAARARARVRARDRRRHRRQPRACRPAGCAPRSTGTPGSVRRSSAGSRATSRRTSCAACSTSDRLLRDRRRARRAARDRQVDRA
jgi:hypothetical protein